MNTVDKIINLAKAEVGYLEKSRDAYVRNPAVIWYKVDGAGYDNITKYAYEIDRINWYNGPKQGYAWCSTYVDWCFIKAYGEETARHIKNHGLYDAVVDYAIDQYKSADRWFDEPEVGDQIFFSKSNGVDPAHTGLVVDVDDTYVHTVEGNTSGDSGVEANGGGVFAKKYRLNYWRILGYGRPFYDKEDDYMSKDEILKELGDQWIHSYEDLPEWARPYVRYMLDNGIINGGTSYETDPDDINMFLSDIKNLICSMRLMGINP